MPDYYRVGPAHLSLHTSLNGCITFKIHANILTFVKQQSKPFQRLPVADRECSTGIFVCLPALQVISSDHKQHYQLPDGNQQAFCEEQDELICWH